MDLKHLLIFRHKCIRCNAFICRSVLLLTTGIGSIISTSNHPVDTMSRLEALQSKSATKWLSYAELVELQKLQAVETSTAVLCLIAKEERPVSGWLILDSDNADHLAIYRANEKEVAERVSAGVAGTRVQPLYL